MAFVPNTTIYTDIFQRMQLSAKHRIELKSKRGFTDETIDFFQFKSGSPYYDEFTEQLIEKYSYIEMYGAGLLEEKDGKRKLVWNFLNPDKIVIPWIDENNTCYMFKAHKNGSMAGLPPVPYCNKSRMRYPEKKHIVLCESELKAAAMSQLGYNAIGLAGIATFSGGLLATLLTDIKDFTRITILFDTEIQNDPSLASYKDDFRKRYAQLIWSYVMGKRIQKEFEESRQVLIATLPESWTVDGKVDVDSALAAGRTSQEFDKILVDALPPDEYRFKMKIPEEHRAWVNKRMDAHVKGASIQKKNNCYWVQQLKKEKGGFVNHPKEVSNFVVEVVGSYDHNGQAMRLVRLVSTFHEKTPPFFLSHEDLTNAGKFKALGLSKGDFLWKGSDGEMNAMVEQMILDGDSVPMRLLDYVGNDEDNQQWVFGNMIIKYDGRILKPNEMSKVVYQREFKEESTGWRINPLGSSVIPELSTEPIDPDMILEAFHSAWGTEGVLALAYMVASLFSTDIFNEYQMFPFCLIYGEKESGKTTMSDAMMFCLGFPPNQTSMNIAETTAVAINRKMNYYRSLPCRFDEYRTGEKKIDDKKSIMRSIYNRQSSTKGLRTPWGVREVEPKGTFILVGEQKPDDPALISRCVPLYLTRFSRSANSYEATRWLYGKNKALSYLTYHVLKDYKKYRDTIMEDIATTNASLLEQSAGNMDMRTQTHYAILMCVLGNVFGEEIASPHISKIHTALLSTVKKFDHESMLNRFLNEVNTMRIMGEPVYKYLALDYENHGVGVMYFSGLYQEWKRWKQQRGGGSMFDESTLREYLSSQPYYEKGGQVRVMKELGNQGVSCILLRIDHKSTSAPLQELYKEMKNYAHTENQNEQINFGGAKRK